MPLEEPKSSEQSDNFEVEQQLILRMPSLPAASLKAAVKSGVLNLKDRLTIQVDQDIRNGTVRFDGWVLSCKIFDLPSIIESHKTLDKKNFYKTSDISQIMICKEEADEVKEDVEENVKKSKDGKDKKFLYPHGITKPLKNVRKKRFRKTLRKKYVDFPEIEKEVKRLLRTDNEAKSVRYEIVNADDELKNDPKNKDMSMNSAGLSSAYDVGDLFGDVVSSSDDEGDSDDGSRMSTAFKDYLKDDVDGKIGGNSNFSFSQILKPDNMIRHLDSTNDNEALNSFESEENKEATSSIEKGEENDSFNTRLLELEAEIESIQAQRLAQQIELNSIENMALKQRFQTIIDDLESQETLKKSEYEQLKSLMSM